MALSARKLTVILALVATGAGAGAVWEASRIQQIDSFNHAIQAGKSPVVNTQSFEAKFAAAYWLGKSGRYQDATLLFLQLLEKATPEQQAEIQYNLGNIFFLRGLAINGQDLTVRDEAIYLITQAKTAYMQSLRLNSDIWQASHNLDRVLGMLPDEPAPGVSDQGNPGLIMGNIPVGLP